MAKRKNGVNKSEEVRQLLKANPAITFKEVSETLAGKGIKIAPNLFYFVKGKMKGRKQRAKGVVTKVTASTHGSRSDAVSMILKVKALAGEVGGMKTLRALVDALSE